LSSFGHAHARALFRGGLAGTSEQEIEDSVSARIQRQTVLERNRPPTLWVLFDEGVLHRLIGSREIMYEQLDHLVIIASRPNVTIQVVPHNPLCTAGLASGFIIAEMPDSPTAVSIESAGRGEVSSEHEFVLMIWDGYDRLRAEALPAGQSLEKIKEARDQWKPQI